MKIEDFNANLQRTKEDVRALTPSTAGAIEDNEKLVKRLKDTKKTIADNARKAGMKPLEEKRYIRTPRTAHTISESFNGTERIATLPANMQTKIRKAVVESLTKTYGKAPLGMVAKVMRGRLADLDESLDWRPLVESVVSDRIRKGDLDYNEESDAWEATEGDTRVQFQDRESRTTEFGGRKDDRGNIVGLGRKLNRQPKTATNTWGRVWHGKNGFKSFEGPKYKVRQDVARYVDSLKESMGETYVGRAYYGNNYSGLIDDIETNDYDALKEWIWEQIQNGAYVEAEGLDGYKHRYSPDKVEWGAEVYDVDDYRVD